MQLPAWAVELVRANRMQTRWQWEWGRAKYHICTSIYTINCCSYMNYVYIFGDGFWPAIIFHMSFGGRSQHHPADVRCFPGKPCFSWCPRSLELAALELNRLKRCFLCFFSHHPRPQTAQPAHGWHSQQFSHVFTTFQPVRREVPSLVQHGSVNPPRESLIYPLAI